MGGLSISASGINNALRRNELTAHNIANSQTPEFRAARAVSVDIAGGGVGIGEITRDTTSTPETSPTGTLEFPPSPAQRSNVNLATELTNTLVNKNAFQANVAAFKAQADLLGELLDLSE